MTHTRRLFHRNQCPLLALQTIMRHHFHRNKRTLMNLTNTKTHPLMYRQIYSVAMQTIHRTINRIRVHLMHQSHNRHFHRHQIDEKIGIWTCHGMEIKSQVSISQWMHHVRHRITNGKGSIQMSSNTLNRVWMIHTMPAPVMLIIDNWFCQWTVWMHLVPKIEVVSLMSIIGIWFHSLAHRNSQKRTQMALRSNQWYHILVYVWHFFFMVETCVTKLSFHWDFWEIYFTHFMPSYVE